MFKGLSPLPQTNLNHPLLFPPMAYTLTPLTEAHTFLSLEVEAFLKETGRTEQDLQGPVFVYYSDDDEDDHVARHYRTTMLHEELCMYTIGYDAEGDATYVQGVDGWLFANLKQKGWVQFRCAPQDGGEPSVPVLRQKDPVDPVFYSLLGQQLA
jgi:hypothetical protein